MNNTPPPFPLFNDCILKSIQDFPHKNINENWPRNSTEVKTTPGCISGAKGFSLKWWPHCRLPSDKARSEENTLLAFSCSRLLVFPQKADMRTHNHTAVKCAGTLWVNSAFTEETVQRLSVATVMVIQLANYVNSSTVSLRSDFQVCDVSPTRHILYKVEALGCKWASLTRLKTSVPFLSLLWLLSPNQEDLPSWTWG